MSLKLQVIICSTRPGRIGPTIGEWFYTFAQSHGEFETEFVDLADFNLPIYDEPNHPRLQNYEKAHTKAWSEKISQADAFVFVLPEYNFCPPPSFVNALNYLFNEWGYKPCGFVSYGGVSGGLRSTQLAKQLVTTLRMMPVPEAVTIQLPWQLVNDKKEFQPQPPHESSAKALLDELERWAGALQPVRQSLNS